MKHRSIPTGYFLFKENDTVYLSVKSIEEYLGDIQYYLKDEGYQNVLNHIDFSEEYSIEQKHKFFRGFVSSFLPVIKIGIEELKRIKGTQYELQQDEYQSIIEYYEYLTRSENDQEKDNDLNLPF